MFGNCPIGIGESYNTSLEDMCPAKPSMNNATITGFGNCITSPNSTHHRNFTYCYVIDDSTDYNNT